MPEVKYTGSANVEATDYKYVKYVGKTKNGKEITIELTKAINKGNIDWTFAEKDDVVPELEFEGVYDDTKLAQGDKTEPFTITLADGSITGNDAILLGVGAFYLGTSSADAKCIGLTRGGGSFTVEREYREINADDDPGAVEGRIVKEGGRPKIKFKALQFLASVKDLYSCLKIAA